MTVYNRDAFFVAGGWQKSQGSSRLPVVCPTSEEIIGNVPQASAADVDTAVAAARRAFDQGPWPRMSLRDRGEYLNRFAKSLEARAAEAIDLQILEMGGVRRFIRPTTEKLPLWIRRDVEIAEDIAFREIREGFVGKVLVVREPVGVVGAVLPWNGPVAGCVAKILPAILAGCCVVLKTAPESPLSSYLVAEAIIEAGFPPGVVNILAGGRSSGEALITHPGVDMVTFTGSAETGKTIARLCGERLKPCTLELGGKSAAIILPDADLAALMPSVVAGSMSNSGQVCHATTRILVPDSAADEITSALVERFSRMIVGDPNDAEVEVGPLVSQAHRARVERHIAAAKSDGARAVLGGGRPAIARGWYVEPTIFVGVKSTMRLAQEEVFGPVLAVMTYEDVDEAVRLANDSNYGLGGAVYGADPEECLKIAQQIRTGTCAVNNAPHGGGGGPFGGYKQSGIGREIGREGIEAFLLYKSLALPPAIDVSVGALA